MANVTGVQGPGGQQPPEPTGAVSRGDSICRPGQTSDSVEISVAAKLAAKARQIPDVRADLVARVRAEILAGTYETPERLEIALDRLLEELFPNSP